IPRAHGSSLFERGETQILGVTTLDMLKMEQQIDLGVEVDLIPRAHGSSLFERGETQILGVTTLDMLKMEQQI
ncbi:hypothetical protein HT105_25380, partial [Bacteroides fragilis]|nr:hypothetical protein [Bacteroides fragilis]